MKKYKALATNNDGVAHQCIFLSLVIQQMTACSTIPCTPCCINRVTAAHFSTPKLATLMQSSSEAVVMQPDGQHSFTLSMGAQDVSRCVVKHKSVILCRIVLNTQVDEYKVSVQCA